ncbi:MAG: TfoX/Sxy family protein [Patescibacteria group bacterium]|jgi:TfoX/Sxy family transcriptional regulator of competence genes
MASSQKTVDFIVDQIASAGSIRSRKMFGEYAIYCDEKVVALVCDDELFVKITEAGRAMLDTIDEAQAYPGAKPSFRIAGELWEDREFLTKLIRTTCHTLPVPKKKQRKSR